MEWVSHQREGFLHTHLLYDVHLVAFSSCSLTLRLSDNISKNFPHQLQELLKKKRGEAWTIAISEEIGQPTLHEKKIKALEKRQHAILQDPLVKALREAFPGTLVET